jgi:hypothetical protein
MRALLKPSPYLFKLLVETLYTMRVCVQTLSLSLSLTLLIPSAAHACSTL